MAQGTGPVRGKARRAAKRADLLKRRDQLQATLFDLDQQLEALDDAGGGPDEPTPRGPGRPLRAAMLDVLEDLGWIAYSREVALYLNANYGRDISPTRFGSLGIDEIKAYDSSRPRSVYLCYALTHDRFEPIKRLWGRSDWELARRIVAPTTGRVQHLKMTARLCELVLKVRDTAADPNMLQIIAADHARDLPGIKFRRGEFPVEEWRDIALKLLADLEPPDRERREVAAARLAELPDRDQLFGAREVPVFGLPKTGSAAHEEGRRR
jgi:hypothetical protein